MEKIEKRFFELPEGVELREADGKTTLRAYAVKYNELSRSLGWGFREKFAPGAFDKALSADFRNVSNDTICRFEHATILGRRSSGTLQIGSDDTGLWYEIDLPNTTTGNDVKELVKRGDIRHSSFAFITAQKGETWEQNDEFGEVRTVENVSYLRDVSPVSDPAYPQTEGFESVKRSFDDWKTTQKPEDWKTNYRKRTIDLMTTQL